MLIKYKAKADCLAKSEHFIFYTLNKVWIGMSLLCPKFHLLFFQEFPQKVSHYSFFVLIPSLLFHNIAQHEIM